MRLTVVTFPRRTMGRFRIGLNRPEAQRLTPARTSLSSERHSTAPTTGQSLSGSAVQELPRMTSVLNNAKRETGMVLQDQLDSMAEGRRIVTETIRTLDVILGSEPTASA